MYLNITMYNFQNPIIMNEIHIYNKDYLTFNF